MNDMNTEFVERLQIATLKAAADRQALYSLIANSSKAWAIVRADESFSPEVLAVFKDEFDARKAQSLYAHLDNVIVLQVLYIS